MVTRRYLGGSWAMVHGPADPANMWRWVLDQGFAGLAAGPGPRALDWRALVPAMADLPVAFGAVRQGSALELPRREHGTLAAATEAERAPARRAVLDAVRLAQRLGCGRIVLDPGAVRVSGEEGPTDLGDPSIEWTPDRAKAQRARCRPGRDAAVDAVCRELWQMSREFPEMTFCLTPSRSVLGVGDPDAMEDILSELRGRRVGYWHDAPVAARRAELLEEAQGDWLERFSNSMQGMTLGDSADGTLYLPPGAGGVDYPLLGSYRRRSGEPLPAVIELDPGVDPGEMPGVHAFLDKFGL